MQKCRHNYTLCKKGSLADAKVNARQQCAYERKPLEEIFSKSTICDFLLMVNCGRLAVLLMPFARYFRVEVNKKAVLAQR